MCEWGNTVPVLVRIPANLSFTGKARWDTKPIDRCIAPIVSALQAAHIDTRSSCCGHGKGSGEITLGDSRVLVVQGEART